MTPHQVLAVVVRVFTIWLFLQLGLTIANSLMFAVKRGSDSFTGWYLVILIFLAICIFLWKFPLTVAKKILPNPFETSPNSSVPGSWFSLGCILIGIFVAANAIPVLVSYLVTWLWTYRTELVNGFPKEWTYAISLHCTQLAIGIWLIFGNRGLKRFLERENNN